MEEKTIKKLTTVYYIILVFSLLFVTLFIYLNKVQWLPFVEPMSKTGQTMQACVILYLVISLPVIMFWFKKQCDKLKPLSDETEKLTRYQGFSIIRLIVVGAGLQIGIVAYYLLGGHDPMIWCAAISAIGLIFCKPNRSRLVLELNNIKEL